MIGEEAVAQVAATLRISTNRARRLAHTALPAGFVRSVTGHERVLLVEGATDAAVWSELLPAPVVPVGGKHVLPLAVAVARAHGSTVHVVLDGDGGRYAAARGSERVLTGLGDTVVHVLPQDLESALAQWPSFLGALHARGSALQTKDAAAYGDAARAAGHHDLPPVLRTLVSALV